MPRATTAACEVIPPRVVKIPSAACMPWTSSGEVSTRTRITLWPALLSASASSDEKTISPQAAPGEAGGDDLAFGFWIDRRMQELIERAGIDTFDRLFFVDQLFSSQIDRNAQ